MSVPRDQMSVPRDQMSVPRDRLLWFAALWLGPALMLLGLGGAVGIPGAVLAAAAIAVALTDWLISRPDLDSVTVQAPAMVHAVVGRPFDLQLQLRWSGAEQKHRLEFDLPAEFEELSSLCPIEPVAREQSRSGQRFTARYQVRERGRFALGLLHVEIRSRLGFFGIRRALSADIWVHSYPDLRRDRRQLAAQNWSRALGAMATAQAGRGRAFDRLRDYVPGDEPDDIHWRATAKRRRPITKLYQLEKDQRVYVAIDHSRLSGRPSPREDRETNPESLLERYINSALLLGAVAHAQGDQFGLLGFGDRVSRFSSAGAGPLHYRACREAILQLRTERVNPDYRELFGFFATHERRRSLLIVLTSVDDPALCEELIESARLIADRHLVITAAVRPEQAQSLAQAPPITDPRQIVDRLAAHLQWKRLHHTARTLGRQGIRFLTLEHQTMVPLIVGSYARVKRGQLL